MELSKRANLHGVREVRLAAPSGVAGAHWGIDLALRDDDDPEFWRYTGEASVVENPYTVYDMFGEFTETIRDGAFKRTLAEDPLVSFVWMHDMSTLMAQTRGRGLTLKANPNLSTDARIAKSDPDAQRLYAKDAGGLAGAMSFAFRVTKQTWNEDYTEREILEINLQGGDVSAIATGHGANPAAHGGMRSVDLDAVMRWIDTKPSGDAEFDALVAAIEARRDEPAVDHSQQHHDELRALMALRRPPVLL